MIKHKSPWICPVCQSPLQLTARQWRCDHSHNYDQAKSGYVNLLLANQKNRPQPGDSKEMTIARRRFLEAGHYLPLIDCVLDVVLQCHLSKSLAIYDAGCGEGYYLDKITTGLDKAGYSVAAAGNDVSRAAVEKASKKYPAASFAIASSFNLPVASRSQDFVLQIFAPGKVEEMHRILKDGGCLLKVGPGQSHLAELKSALYQTPSPHVVDHVIPEGFDEIQESTFGFEFQLFDNRQKEDLIKMTPYYWSAGGHDLNSIVKTLSTVTAEFSLRLLKKKLIG